MTNSIYSQPSWRALQGLAMLLIGLAFSNYTAAADIPRLMLWVTESIGASNATQCKLAEFNAPSLPSGAPTLTEQDVTGWDAKGALWTLNSTRFAVADAGHVLNDHCFVLAIDGMLVSSGVVLSSYSARRITFPTISVSNQNLAVTLQLNSGHQGDRSQPIHVSALNSILALRPDFLQPPAGN